MNAFISSVILIISGIALGDTSMDRIMSALDAGEITDTQAADLLVKSVKDTENLPACYLEGTDVMLCGTPALLVANRLYGETEFPLPNRPVLSGPEYTFNSADGFFKIHWTDSGADSVSFDYANSVSLAADSSWRVQCIEMNFFTPPPDNQVGGDDLYDIYIVGTIPGWISTMGEYHPPDSSHACSASHIGIACNLVSDGFRNCTVSHEFQHAIQSSYAYDEPIWFMENCAVWMEEIVYPDVDFYKQHLGYGENPLRTPWIDIRTGPSYCFGATIWPWMMWNRWGYESVREIWEICADVAGRNMISAHEQMFGNHGSDFESFFMEYGCWRWFTADNWFLNCNMYIREASSWNPGPRVLADHSTSTLPFSGDQTTSFEPEYLGIHWIEVDLRSYQNDWIQMAFNGYNGFSWNMGVIMQDYSGRFHFDWYNCDPASGDITVSVCADGWDAAIFFPALMTNYPLYHEYTFEITSLGTGMEESPSNTDLLNLNVSSNPFQTGDYVTFDMPAAGNVSLYVYDMSGRSAAKLIDEPMQAGSHSIRFEGADLAEGTYFVVMFTGNQISAQKVVFTR